MPSPSVRAMLRVGSPAGASPPGHYQSSPILSSPPRGLLLCGAAADAASFAAGPVDWALPRLWRSDAGQAQPGAAAGAGAAASVELLRQPLAPEESPVAVLGRQPPPHTSSPRGSAGQQQQQPSTPAGELPNNGASAAAPPVGGGEPGLASQVKALQAQLAAIKRRNGGLAERMRLGNGAV